MHRRNVIKYTSLTIGESQYTDDKKEENNREDTPPDVVFWD